MLDEQIPEMPPNGVACALIPSRSAATSEVELKLLAPAGALERLWEAPIMHFGSRHADIVQQFESIYYDTDDRRLFTQGMSLHVRRSALEFTQIVRRGT